MQTAIEITSHALRVARFDQGKLVDLERIPLPEGADPIAALASAPLPSPLGPVRVILTHRDLLVRTFIQPPTNPERLDRLIRFELQSLNTDSGGIVAAWKVIPIGGAGDMRVIALVAKQSLVDQLKQAVQGHGGRLNGCTVNGVGLFQSWRTANAINQCSGALVDIGSENVHICLISDGEIAFVRSQSPGMGAIIKDIAELRGIDEDAAAELASKLGARAPKDIKAILERHAGQIATQITNCVRFAKAQLHVDQFELQEVYLSGAGARAPGLADTIASKTQCPVRLINPFAARIATLHTERLDKEAWLPGSWAPVIGAAGAETLGLDVMDQIRAERRTYWSTSGALRIAAIAAALLLAAAIGITEVRAMAQNQTHSVLHNDGQGLVPLAEVEVTKSNELRAEIIGLHNRVQHLHHERATGRTAVELLNLVAQLQDPSTQPVYIRNYRVEHRAGGLIQVELEGFTEDARTRKKSEVLNDFKQQLQDKYPIISQVQEVPVAVQAQRQPFYWVLDLDVDG